MKLVIIDYGAGNTRSVKFALERLGIEPVLSRDKEVIAGADKIIFPGVGHAKAAMEVLVADELATFIPQLKQPVLGICLGMQLMCKHSEEGDTPCLGIINETVKLFEPKLKVPHTGWNQCIIAEGKPHFDSAQCDIPSIQTSDKDEEACQSERSRRQVLPLDETSPSGLPQQAIPTIAPYYYFVHSYYVPVNQYTTFSCNYINDFSAAFKKDNFYGAQFHPEKSGPAGEEYLKWFLAQ